MTDALAVLVVLSGFFTVSLGVWHLGVPTWFDFRGAIEPDEARTVALRPYRVGPFARANQRREVLGLSWVMSYAASYALVSIGIVDLAIAWGPWTAPAIVPAWIAGWWGVRAGSQLAIGHRRLDLAMVAAFGVLAVIHLWLAAQIGFGGP